MPLRTKSAAKLLQIFGIYKDLTVKKINLFMFLAGKTCYSLDCANLLHIFDICKQHLGLDHDRGVASLIVLRLVGDRSYYVAGVEPDSCSLCRQCRNQHCCEHLVNDLILVFNFLCLQRILKVTGYET